MKLILASILLATTLTSCGTNWQALGQRVGTAALDASIPVIQEGLKPAAKQPVNVKP